MATTENTTRPDSEQEHQASSSGNPFNRNALNLPNLITGSRLVLAIVLFTLIYIQGYWRTAAAVFIFAAWTDALDGWIARRYGMVTVLGRILDPFVDKIIIGGAFIFLSEKRVPLNPEEFLHSGVNAWMTIIIIGREMFITSLRGFLEQQGKDFSASLSGKIKMVLQCVAVPVALLSLDPHPLFHSTGYLLFRNITLWFAVAVTVWSGVIYVFRAVEMLRSE